jgi:phage terminase large subunit GpA-like protein
VSIAAQKSRTTISTGCSAATEWRSAATGDGKTAGFHLSSLYSPVGWFSWTDAAAMFEKAHKNPALLQVFVNTVLGESWALQGEAPEWQRLYDRREDHPIGVVPAGGLFLTCGVDVQRDRIEAEIVAWGRNKKSWSIDYRVMEGDTSRSEVWAKLTSLLGERFKTQAGVDMQIVRMAVDSGYATQEVYSWARTQASARVMVVKGVHQDALPVGQPTALDVTHAGKRVSRGIKVWPVSVGILKSELYGWLRLERPSEESGVEFPPGYCHFPKYQEEYFKQLTAEQLVTRVVKGYRRTECKRRGIGMKGSIVVYTHAQPRLSMAWTALPIRSGVHSKRSFRS